MTNKLEKIMLATGFIGAAIISAGGIMNNKYVVLAGLGLSTNLGLVGVIGLAKEYKSSKERESQNKSKLYLIK